MLLVTAAVLPYLFTLNYAFVFDDPVFIEKNPAVRALQPVGRYFTDPETLSSKQEYVHQIYRPLRTLAFSGLYGVFGSNPVPFHLLNLLLHVLCTLLVYSLARSLRGEEFVAWVAAALFAVHPVHSEAVTWISSLADVLSTAAVLATLRLFVSKSSSLRIIAVAVVFPVALLSKEPAITVPVLLTAIAVYRRAELGEGPLRRVTYGAIGGSYIVAVSYFFWRAHVLGQVGQTPLSMEYFFHALGRVHLVLFEYVRLTIVPSYLCSLRVPLDTMQTGIITHFVAACSLLVSAGAVVVGFRRRSFVSLAVLLFLISLTPILNLLPVVVDIAERFAYLPSVFFAMLLAEGFFFFKQAGASRLATILTGAVLLAFALRLAVYNRTWETPLSVATAQAECVPPDPNAFWNLGNALVDLGRWKEAATSFETLLAFDENRVSTLNNLAFVQLQLKRFDRAELLSRKSLQADPDNISGKNNLGAALVGRGRHREALTLFREITASAPDHFNAWVNRGISAAAVGELDEAAAAYDAAIALRPDAPLPRRLKSRLPRLPRAD